MKSAAFLFFRKGENYLNKNYLTYPFRYMKITQNYNGITSHLPHTTGTPKDYPIDEAGKDSSRDFIYCPCDRMTVKKVYGVGSSGTNTLWLQSTDKVYFADGTADFFTMLITHPNDDDMRKIRKGTLFLITSVMDIQLKISKVSMVNFPLISQETVMVSLNQN